MLKSFVLVPALLSAMALSAFAQGAKVDTDPKSTETMKVTVSGSLDIDWVWRDRALGTSRGTYGTYDPGESRGEGVMHGHYSIRVDADLSDKVKLTVVLENNRYDTAAPSNDLLGTNPEGLPVSAHEVQIAFGELFTAGMSGTIGTHGYMWSPRGDGRSLIMAMDSSDSILPASAVADFQAGGLNQSDGSGQSLRPAGAVFAYTQEAWGMHFALLPATVEGGSAKADEANYAVDFFYNLASMGKGSNIGAILMLTSIAGGESAIFTGGFGGDLFFMDNNAMELYFQVLFQSGTWFEVGTTNIKAGGIAFEIGGKYNFTSAMHPWIQAQITYLSGDKDQDPGDTDIDAFLGYENNNDLMIILSDFYGMDWFTNMLGILISGGLDLSVGAGKDNLHFKGVLGIMTTVEDVRGPLFTDTTNKLGNEFDVMVVYDYSKQVAFNAGIALLFGSEVLEAIGGGSTNDNADDSSMLFTIGAHAKF